MTAAKSTGRFALSNEELAAAIKEALSMIRLSSSGEPYHHVAERHYGELLAIQLARAKAAA